MIQARKGASPAGYEAFGRPNYADRRRVADRAWLQDPVRHVDYIQGLSLCRKFLTERGGSLVGQTVVVACDVDAKR